ncbi:hypothetical protein BDZ97DRAFT_1853796 [Flammula alnicola]|nr:hypothetical protein BDZ97DRAFT_1853796 [Flammula alnicola]
MVAVGHMSLHVPGSFVSLKVGGRGGHRRILSDAPGAPVFVVDVGVCICRVRSCGCSVKWEVGSEPTGQRLQWHGLLFGQRKGGGGHGQEDGLDPCLNEKGGGGGINGVIRAGSPRTWFRFPGVRAAVGAGWYPRCLHLAPFVSSLFLLAPFLAGVIGFRSRLADEAKRC